MGQSLTIHLDKPVQIDLLIKQLRSLKRTSVSRGGTRRTVFAGSNNNSVVFEASFGLEPSPSRIDRTPPTPKKIQKDLFE